jgi:hypothetical protein
LPPFFVENLSLDNSLYSLTIKGGNQLNRLQGHNYYQANTADRRFAAPADVVVHPDRRRAG